MSLFPSGGRHVAGRHFQWAKNNLRRAAAQKLNQIDIRDDKYTEQRIDFGGRVAPPSLLIGKSRYSERQVVFLELTEANWSP